MIIVLIAFEFWNMDSFYYLRYHSEKQQKMHLSSALSIFCNDSVLAEQMRTEKKYQLYPEDEHSLVFLQPSLWGLYECVGISNFDHSIDAVYLVGKSQDTYNSPALWVCERDHPISLSGEAKISGELFLPKSGLSYINLNFDTFRGEIIPSTVIHTSDKDLPRVDSVYLQSLRTLKNPPASLSNEVPSRYHSFLNEPVYASVTGTSDELYAKGKIILYGDKVHLDATSKISDIILVARYVTIESGFSGALQIMASDTIEIEKGAYLHYPSGIYMHGNKDKAYLHVGLGSRIEGYIVVEGNVEGGDGFVVDVHYRQDKDSQLTGLLYVDGIAHLEGTIRGAAYLKECYYLSGENMYSGLIYGGKIIRSDALAFPFLFKESGYNRKSVKKIE